MAWQHWTYTDWNERLIERCLGSDATNKDEPVQSLHATREDLCELAGEHESQSVVVVDAFVERVRSEIPPRQKSFCGYCLDYEGWTPNDESLPHFFAMLWLTCLVAHGHPPVDGDFNVRLRSVLGRFENFQYGTEQRPCLPKLWEDLREWTRNQQRIGNAIRLLELPADVGRRTVIGYSHYLAFPNREDRTALCRVLLEGGVVGFEPPILPVLDLLATEQSRFSVEFRSELTDFRASLASGKDPRDSPFWRAVRRESLAPYSLAERTRRDRDRTTMLFAEEEDGLVPTIACHAGYEPPSGFSTRALSDQEPWRRFVAGVDDEDAAISAALSNGMFLPLAVKKLLEQGLLVLQPIASWLYDVVSGGAISGCRNAFVREDRVTPFIQCFGGKKTRSRWKGWFLVSDCVVRPLEVLPEGLEGVFQLLPTMAPPSLAIIGVRTAGGFFARGSFAPRIRAPGAIRLEATYASQTEPCRLLDPGLGEWGLPEIPETVEACVLTAEWPPGDGLHRRSTAAKLRLVRHQIDDVFKPVPSSAHYREACPNAEQSVEAGVEVPLGITTAEPLASADLLEFDATVRYLGPGCGELSLEPRPGFDWLVVGPKNKPELLVYVGDVSSPTALAHRRSPLGGDRDAWRNSFNATRRYVRDGNKYEPIVAKDSPMGSLIKSYRNHRPASDAEECAPTRLPNGAFGVTKPRQTQREVQDAIDIVAALSCRRSGLRYGAIKEVLETLTSGDIYLVPHVLRAWAESGIVDILREARSSRQLVVARRPRFAVVRRGPDVEATVVGCVTSLRWALLSQALEKSGLPHRGLLARNDWQPDTIRVRGRPEDIEALRIAAGLEASEWLRWSGAATDAPWFDARAALDALHRTLPPDAYRLDATWVWSERRFVPGTKLEGNSVGLERRRHADGSSICVVSIDGTTELWCEQRNWALLAAYGLSKTAPFKMDSTGDIVSIGLSPVYLPLPLARLCVLLGEGPPGLDEQPSAEAQRRYLYPFGRRLGAIVKRLVPAEWLVNASLGED